MPLLSVMCPICTDLFHDSDDIYSTDCGHLFHFACMNDWKRRGTSCPQCRHYSPLTFKLYLSFDETEENSERVKELESELKKSNEKITLLLIEAADMETNFMQLQKQFTSNEEIKRELELKIRQLNDSEENFLKLQGQYTESAEQAKELENRVKELLIENECKAKEWRLKSLERESLQNGFCTENSVFTNTEAGQRIRTLEQKLKIISEELAEEIRKNSQLSIDKIELERKIKQIENNNNETKASTCQENGECERAKDSEFRKQIALKHCNLSNQNEDDYTKRSIFIKSFPKYHIEKPLEYNIIHLAEKMQLFISPDDLINVSVVHDNDVPSKVCLSVQFKHLQHRNEFIAKKSMLQMDPVMRNIAIREFLSDELLELLSYAKEKLRNNGFNHFFYKNGKIMAKKNRSHPKVVNIPNKAFVDVLLSRNKTEENGFIDLRSISEGDHYVLSGFHY